MRRSRFFYSIVLGEFDGNLHAKRHDSYLYVVDRFSDAAGIVFSIYTQVGVGVELDAIASVVIGGTLLSGGGRYGTGDVIWRRYPGADSDLYYL